MPLLGSEVPVKMYENVTGLISSLVPAKLQNGTVKSVHYKKTSTVTGGKKAILDGAIKRRLFPVEFEWNGPADDVMITGSFYDWEVNIPLHKKSDKFYAKIDLPRGQHEFKFVVNGVWKCSHRYPTTSNGFGDFNNYVEV